jgi:putative ABC transport system permease protein
MMEVVLGFIALAVAIVMLAPALLGVVAVIGRHAPVGIRIALRDLARYRVRSGPALAAISLSTLIAVIICVESAARFGNVLDYAGPNLTSSQLIVYTNGGQYGFGAHFQSGPGAPSIAQEQQVASRIAVGLGTNSVITLESTSAGLTHAARGRSWSGPIYVATPQLLKAFGISPSQVSPDADILTMRPGLS